MASDTRHGCCTCEVQSKLGVVGWWLRVRIGWFHTVIYGFSSLTFRLLAAGAGCEGNQVGTHPAQAVRITKHLGKLLTVNMPFDMRELVKRSQEQ